VRKLLTALAGLVAVAAVVAVPAGAITDGELDNNGHPAVVLVLMEVDGAPAFRCTGTLIAPTFVITAGHCAGEPGEFSGIRVFAEADVQHDPTYPFAGGPNTVEAVRWASFPGFTEDLFFLHDVGMIELAKPISLPAGASYGRLPTAGQFNSFNKQRGKQDISFTSVGYGLQQSFPDAASWKEHNQRIRMVAHPKLNQIDTGFVGDFSMLLSNNTATGGTCFGDSGGPNYLGGNSSNLIAAVTSFGINGNCAGTGGVFRLDKQPVLDFVNGFMAD
jgi:secreted trypsin-like serine protease